ncbi:MAG: hypothetical protein JXA54_07465 [Candidatus Heimdallarchaeota archaeon]|nr:hypothetical protein [Candidatus Heimdallarchaeota archaeon]
MKLNRIFKSKKAVSATIATVMMIGITIVGVAAVYGFMSGYNNFQAKINESGAIKATDFDRDGLIDTITLSLINTGMDDARVQSVSVYQASVEYVWYTFDTEIELSSYAEINIYASAASQQIQPLQAFYVEINFENEVYNSPGYIAVIASEIPDEIVSGIGVSSFPGYNYLVARTSDDDVYGNKNFPTETGYSPTMWFILGEFDDNNKKPNLSTDYIDLCGYGSELEYAPYILDNTEFLDGGIGTQSGYKILPYEDGGNHPGLVAIDKYGNWDKNDDLNWGHRGVVYLWSYIYVPGTEGLSVSLGANGASEYKVYLNGEFIVEGNNKNKWYTTNDLILTPGLNLVLMKVSAGTNAHFAGQVLFFNNALLANAYSVWPTLADL